MATMCWICGTAEATTREHIAKRSDVKDIIGQGDRFFLHTAKSRNIPVNSLNSKKLKFEKSLCSHCNHTLTQPHDFAWEEFSSKIRNWTPSIEPGRKIRANRIFKYDTTRKMRNIHLYFVKWMGCRIIEAGVPLKISSNISIESLSNSIRFNRAHPHLWISFGVSSGGNISSSDLDLASFSAKMKYEYVASIYTVDGLSVRIRCCAKRIPDDWHPQDGNCIRLADCRE